MKANFTLLAATALVSLMTAAHAQDQSAQSKSKTEYKSNGGYESTTSSEKTATDGTNQTSQSKVNVDVDSSGKTRKTVTNESTTDPKGLMNAKKDSAKTDIKEKDRGGYVQTTTSKHLDADGTNITIVTTTDVDVDNSGKITTTAKTEKTVDPKGMFNQKTTSSETKSVNGQIVEQKKKVD